METENRIAAITKSTTDTLTPLPSLGTSQSTVTANREYKSTMFSMIFRDKKELLELYNAVNHSDYTNMEALQIVTLENAIYMNMKNDLAFVIDMHLNLYEHQSTFNPNMPLRDLLYVAREYQKLVKDESIYASTPVKLPAPRFIVFYNGRDDRPAKEVLKLSDAYYTKEEEPELELKVTILNINKGKDQELLTKCNTLREYMQYVDCVRRYTAMPGVTLDEAVTRAVNECIEKGILSEFLRKNKAEAISVSIFEYNEAEEKEKLRRAEYAVGYHDGIEQGTAQGLKQSICLFIESFAELGISKQDTLVKLKEKFDLEEQELQQYMEKYWKPKHSVGD